MKIKFFKLLLVSLAFGMSLNANSGVILNGPSSAMLGDSFEVEVSFDVIPNLDPQLFEAVGGFSFDVTSLFGLTYVGATIAAPFDAPIIPPLAGSVGGVTFFGSTSDPLALAILTFTADSLGLAGFSVESPNSLVQGLEVFGRTDLLSIDGDFRLQVQEAPVPAPASIALLAMGLLLLRRGTN